MSGFSLPPLDTGMYFSRVKFVRNFLEKRLQCSLFAIEIYLEGGCVSVSLILSKKSKGDIRRVAEFHIRLTF